MSSVEPSVLEQIDKIAPLKQFDAFPKIASTYKSRSKGGGLLTILVALLSFFLILNDIGDFFWGWNDYEFSVDKDYYSNLGLNIDIIVKMPCASLSVDLRDVMGDRLHLSDGFTRDGTLFDIHQAERLEAHAKAVSASEVVASARSSRGFFSFFRSSKPKFKPTYRVVPDGSACRIYGSLSIKKVTGNIHITTVGHGYPGGGHTDHSAMNLSHIINEFSFGPFFPDIVQPLDNTLEIAKNPFVIYQYFLTVVPTTYYAARAWPLYTHQYSVTHYTREVIHNKGSPGIFFKFDMEPLALQIHQRTTSFYQFLVRVVGVVGGLWVCFGWGVKIGNKVGQAVGLTTGDDGDSIVAESTSTKKRWGGGTLRARNTRTGDGLLAVDGGSPYTSYTNTPNTAHFSHTGTPAVPFFANSQPNTPGSPSFRVAGGMRSPYPSAQAQGMPLSPNTFSAPPTAGPPRSPNPTSAVQSHFPPSPSPHSPGFVTHGLPPSPAPSSPSFPRSPIPNQGGFPRSPGLASPGFTSQQNQPPPRRESTLRVVSGNASDSGTTTETKLKSQ